MDRTGPACSRNSRTWIRCMAKCACVRMCQLLSCCTMKTSTNGSRQQLLLGAASLSDTWVETPCTFTSACIIQTWSSWTLFPERNASKSFCHKILNQFGWFWIRGIHGDMSDMLCILPYQNGRLWDPSTLWNWWLFPGLPCQARFFPCKLLCWPSYLEDRSKSFQLREAEHIRLTHHVDKCDEYDYHVCVSVLCVCCVFRHCLSLHAILKNDRYNIYIYICILI